MIAAPLYPGVYYDGETARARPVRARIGASAVTLITAPVDAAAWRGRDEINWPFFDLRADPDHMGAGIRLIPNADSDARLIVEDPAFLTALEAAHPNLRQYERDTGVVRKAVFWGAAGVGAVLLMLFVLAPEIAARLAATIPPEQEAALGRRVEQILRLTPLVGDECKAPAGRAALDKLTARLTKAAAPRLPLTVSVIKSPAPNAITLPGGRILIFYPLVRDADGPEEVAGVLAHEIGHVENRDNTRAVLRALGGAGLLSMIMGDFSGGFGAGAGAEHIMNASFSRDAEQAADEHAVVLLGKAGVGSEPLAQFMERMGRRNPGAGLFATHPNPLGRAEIIRAADAGSRGAPVLTPSEWADLREICR